MLLMALTYVNKNAARFRPGALQLEDVEFQNGGPTPSFDGNGVVLLCTFSKCPVNTVFFYQMHAHLT